ncbi:MAG: hypothetical protein AB8B99_13630 [Phormidesmis sp.]
MATPNRLKSAGLRSVLSPFAKIASVITPTGIGVLLSVGAHAALIAFGPRTDFSFAALTEENLAANPEETIVPILQLSAAERNRLPSFAQPRRPPASTGLSSLQLPSGLPSFPSNRTFKRNPIPSQPIPSPTRVQPKPLPRIGQAIPNQSLQPAPFKLNFPVGTPGTSPSASAGTPYIPVPPRAPDTNINSGEGATPVRIDENGIPILEPRVLNPDGVANNSNGASPEPDSPQAGNTALIDVLRGTESAGVTDNATDSPTNGNAEEAPVEAGVTPIPVENNSDTIAFAPAEGDPSQLLKGSNVYDDTGVSDEEAEENLVAWLENTAKDKGQVETETAEITVDSGFKACREIAPVNGLIGVVVNPDGTKDSFETLKSTGYASINSLARTTLEYEDFGQPDVATQYQVDVDVIYAPEDCVEVLPETSAEETGATAE